VGVIDLGTGNLFSVLRGLERAGGQPYLLRTVDDIAKAPRLVLPGVGSFADAMQRARDLRIGDPLREHVLAGTPILGICLGMQLLFERGEEDGSNAGLGLLAGKVVKLQGGAGLTIPHVGWQKLHIQAPCALLPDPAATPWFYFSHSYRAEARPEDFSAVVTHGETFPAVVARENLFGIQPHPEKSGAAGLELLRRFLALQKPS
jgi:glutamine amidotransferase